MSTPEDKATGRGTAGPARCKLEHLQSQFGYRITSGPESRPERVEVSHPGYFARWRRVATDMYEMESTNGNEGTREEDSGAAEAPADVVARGGPGVRRVPTYDFNGRTWRA